MQGLHLEEQMAALPPLGLTMIVKNEADFIAQTLLSVKPHIDYWTIVDTGRISGLSRRRPESLLPHCCHAPYSCCSAHKGRHCPDQHRI